jgi:hypothetical protein
MGIYAETILYVTSFFLRRQILATTGFGNYQFLHTVVLVSLKRPHASAAWELFRNETFWSTSSMKAFQKEPDQIFYRDPFQTPLNQK